MRRISHCACPAPLRLAAMSGLLEKRVWHASAYFLGVHPLISKRSQCFVCTVVEKGRTCFCLLLNFELRRTFHGRATAVRPEHLTRQQKLHG